MRWDNIYIWRRSRKDALTDFGVMFQKVISGICNFIYTQTRSSIGLWVCIY